MKNYDNLCNKYIEYINLNCINNNTQELQCDLVQNILKGCIKFKEKKHEKKQELKPIDR